MAEVHAFQYSSFSDTLLDGAHDWHFNIDLKQVKKLFFYTIIIYQKDVKVNE